MQGLSSQTLVGNHDYLSPLVPRITLRKVILKVLSSEAFPFTGHSEAEGRICLDKHPVPYSCDIQEQNSICRGGYRIRF